MVVPLTQQPGETYEQWMARLQKAYASSPTSQYPMGSMPGLTRPSRQYQARMGPTAMGQYQGYQQATTGATPEETQWRLWQTAPPGGGYRGLSYMR